jgi:hypothetical protein
MENRVLVVLADDNGIIRMLLRNENASEGFRKGERVVANIQLDSGKNPGDMLIAALVGETSGTSFEDVRFAGALRRCLQEMFYSGMEFHKKKEQEKRFPQCV